MALRFGTKNITNNTVYTKNINKENLKKFIENKKKISKVVNYVLELSRIPYPVKSYYNNVVPLNIFQTWHTKNLPPLMENAVNMIKELNPRFNYELFDDNDCREFIKNNFSVEVLEAFDTLVPGAYKADLWRYCILYKKGGIYLDIKYKPANGFKFINMTEKEHFVLDSDKDGIYNALMICKQGNQILLNAIYKIVDNVAKRFYGNSALEPTGPLLLGKYFTSEEKQNLDMFHNYLETFENRFICFNNYLIFKSYTGYLEESNKFKKVPHYGELWLNRTIYK
jgi:mannosyltransferase OCH1-like enzyme